MSKHGAVGSINNFSDDLTHIEDEQRSVSLALDLKTRHKHLIEQINQWKAESIKNIEKHARTAIQTVEATLTDVHDRFNNDMRLLSDEIHKIRRTNTCDAQKLGELQRLLTFWKDEVQRIANVKIGEDASPSIPMIKVEVAQRSQLSPFDQNDNNQSRDLHNKSSQDVSPHTKNRWTGQPHTNHQQSTPRPSEPAAPRLMAYGNVEKIDPTLKGLIEKLCRLPPMDKHGPMSGNCEEQTTQMENFLRKEFAFENIPDQEIVHGVRSFRLRQPPEHQDPNKTIYFPKQQHAAFAMTIEEIRKWQRSYRVYAPRSKTQITSSFLLKALQGGSASGSEAFLMKFVVRISTCPILMEFDARVKDRKIGDQWPHNIKLVSVTGVDFACRIHDVDDVKNYIRNWQEVFVLNSRTKRPEVRGGRDLIIRDRAPKAYLDFERLCQDLTTMARIRLQACDHEGVQIVVETGIGLGVFSGTILGIDETVRRSSATAIRKVLEQDGPHFHNIKAVVFALPIFPTRDDADGLRTSVFQAFTNEFTTANYRGPIPVLVIDQDMHRLVVHIAKLGYCVSALNPADSHGVFGEYWQNRGPGVEEKLALTTLGLLVQHHLMNKTVLDANVYQFI